jgi:superoxide dismutase, Fe-Mn family
MTSIAGRLEMNYELPKLEYAYDALEPHIDARTMEIHHSKHHQAYITNALAALEGHPELRALPVEELLRDLSQLPADKRQALINNAGGHANHSFFWQSLSPQGGGAPEGELSQALAAAFGGFEQFKDLFAKAALGRFGSGWAWLVLDGGELKVVSSANQDSPLSLGQVPLLGLDVWEHAYYLNYQNRRADYIAAFWNVVNWARVSERYLKAR